MKKFCLFAASAALLALMAACTGEPKLQTEKWEDEAFAPLMDSLDVGYSFGASVEYVTGGVSAAVADKMNTAIVKDLFNADGKDVAAAGEVYKNGLLGGYQAEVEEFFGEHTPEEIKETSWMYNWSNSIGGEFAKGCAKRHLLSYMVSMSDYTGGAHGMYGVNYLVFDTTTGEVVKEADLFAEGYEQKLAELLWQHRFDGMEDLDEWEDPDELFYAEIGPNGNFEVTEEGLEYVYNPYEIAPYAAGLITIPVSWKELEPILRK